MRKSDYYKFLLSFYEKKQVTHKLMLEMRAEIKKWNISQNKLDLYVNIRQKQQEIQKI